MFSSSESTVIKRSFRSFYHLIPPFLQRHSGGMTIFGRFYQCFSGVFLKNHFYFVIFRKDFFL